MSETTRIEDEIRRAIEGDPWHGSSIGSILADVKPGEAASRPLPSAHTIWEIVLHLTGWARECARRVREGNPGEPAAGDWPELVSSDAAAWNTARGDLAAAHEELIRELGAMPEVRLDEPVGLRRDPAAGTGVSYYVLLHGVSQHVAYHAGQIALLKKALRTATPKDP